MKSARYRRIRSLSLLILLLALAAELNRRMEAIAAQGTASTKIDTADSGATEEVVEVEVVEAPPVPAEEETMDKTLNALRRAIIGQESGGNFLAVNPHSGALGYGQIMPQNLHCSWDGRPKANCGWDWDAIGADLINKEFLHNPDAQIAIINDRLGRYLAEETSKGFDHDTAIRRVASLWYSGDADLYNNTSPQRYGAGRYPSINDYTLSVLSKYHAEKAQ